MSNFQQNTIRIAKVTDTEPKGNTVSLVFLDNLGIARNAQVVSGSAGTNYGDVNLPEPTKKEEFSHEETKDRDIYAVVAMVNGEPLVMGYLQPQVNQMAFDKVTHPNLRISRHASDFYQVTDHSGNMGLVHPSGSSINIGTPPNLEGQDFDKKWKVTKNTSDVKSISLDIPNKASVTLAAGGFISINSHTESIGIDAARSVSISAGQNIICTASGQIKCNAPQILLN